MLPLTRRAFLSAAALVLAGCIRGPQAGRRPSGRSDLLTREDIEMVSQNNVYDLVLSLRSNWLRTRGADTIMGTPSEVIVYLDGVRYGGVELLRAMNTSTVEQIQHFNGIDASGRWGLDHGAGVIHVTTRR